MDHDSVPSSKFIVQNGRVYKPQEGVVSRSIAFRYTYTGIRERMAVVEGRVCHLSTVI
jgi:hypothetical protein